MGPSRRLLALILLVASILASAAYGVSRPVPPTDLVVAQAPFPDPYTPPTLLFPLTVNKSGTGTGTVTGGGIDCGSDCSQSFNRGTSVTLTASPTNGTFSGWSGAGCSGTGSCVVTMSQAQIVTATFTYGGGATEPIEQWCLNNPSVCVGSRTLNSTGTWTFLNGCLQNNGVGTGCYWESDQPAPLPTLFLGWRDYSSGTERAYIWTNSGVTPLQVASGYAGINAVRLRNTTVINPASMPGSGALGARYYGKYGAGYQTTGDNGYYPTPGGCWNDKKIQIGSGREMAYLTTSGGYFFFAGSGGTPVLPAFDIHPYFGSSTWFKFELYVSDPSLNRHYDVYVTNMSTGVTSSAHNIPCPDGCVEGYGTNDPLHHFREGTCAGNFDVMYVVESRRAEGDMTRIPGACEIEGGC